MGIEELVKDWALTFGLPVNEKPIIPSKERIELCYNLIREEFMEFEASIYTPFQLRDNIDITEVADSLTDTLWCVIRAMQEFGLNPQKCIEAVYESNMSKLCQYPDEVRKTIEMYEKKGITATHTYIGRQGWVIHNKETGKVLKSVNFKEPKFDL